MDIGPKGERRPDDPISRAVMIGKIATGEIKEDYAEEHETQERPRRAARRNGVTTQEQGVAKAKQKHLSGS